MKHAYIFLGPTLDVEQARAELQAVYLPPVSEGDVYRVCRRCPHAIGIIDGYFERVPAVWHKEIMWAMGQGVHVFGSASIGALRAVELEAFGMRGVGWVFQAYRDGILEQDDEVTVAHGLKEHRYRPLSLALVNIRRTLSAALGTAVISRHAHDILISVAKAMFYPDRAWPGVFRQAVAAGADSNELDALQTWLPTGQVDQKAEDAREMLRQMRQFLETDPQPLQVRWRMANTVAWTSARRRAGAALCDPEDPTSTLLEAVLDEVRLLGPEGFDRRRNRSLLRLFAVTDAEREGITIGGKDVNSAADSFRLRRNLETGSQLQEFLTANDMSVADLERLAVVEEKTRWSRDDAEQEAFEGVLDDLRIHGEYEQFAGRARLKQQKLSEHGMLGVKPVELGRSQSEVLQWYFANVLAIAVPENLADYARASGFPDELAFRRAVWREYFFVSLTTQTERRKLTAGAHE